MLAAKLLSASGGVGGGSGPLYVDDVFQSYTRVGTGADVTVTTGIDMTQGYMLWTKGRSGATDHAIYDSARGVTLDLVSNSTAAQTTQATGLKSVSATGHTIGALAKMNTTSATYVDWVFRNADKFYNHTTVTKTAGSNATVSFSNLTTLGMVRVKRTDSTGSWYIWHRSLTAGKLLIGETTAAEATLGHITVSGTTVTLVNGTIADGSYLVEGFAHDTGTDGLIQCGSFTTDGSGNATGNLGWEPQYIQYKASSTTGNWNNVDSARGFTTAGTAGDAYLFPNLSNVESVGGTDNISPSATGFSVTAHALSQTYIYLAIRRPNKPPTTGTQVFDLSNAVGGITTPIAYGLGPNGADLFLSKSSSNAGSYHWWVTDRLRGASGVDASSPWLNSATTNAESTGAAGGAVLLSGASYTIPSTHTYINNSATFARYFFKRAPGVFDVVCYSGNSFGGGRLIKHSLGVAPEFIIVKSRTGAEHWHVMSNDPTKIVYLNRTEAIAAEGSMWMGVPATATAFNVGSSGGVNGNGQAYVAYLFATKAGISKVGSYTGNGSSQTIACGFTTGARFILIKRTDSTGDWYVWDTVRGIVAGNDPHLSLNTTSAEVTTDDSIDPDTSGFIVNQLAATNINVTSATYIFLALA